MATDTSSDALPTRRVRIQSLPSVMPMVMAEALKKCWVVSAIRCRACWASPWVFAIARSISSPAFCRSVADRTSCCSRKLISALAVCRSMAASRSIKAVSSCRSSSAILRFRSAVASSETAAICLNPAARCPGQIPPLFHPGAAGSSGRRRIFRLTPACPSGPRPRHLGFLGGDEFQEHRYAFLGLLDAALDRAHDVLGFGHALAIAAEGARHRRIVAGYVGGAIFLGRDRHHLEFDRHREVVEQDRHDRNPLAHRGLEIHAGETDRGIAPDIDAELVGPCEFGAHRKPEAIAELGGLAPAEIGEGLDRLPERRELIARAAGIMGDDGVPDVDGVL